MLVYFSKRTAPVGTTEILYYNNPPLPKLTLRRDSISGNDFSWFKAPQGAATGTHGPAQNSQSAFTSTRIITENAVTNMFNVIHATFKLNQEWQ